MKNIESPLYRRYTLTVLLLIFSVLIVQGIFVVIIDPLMVYGSKMLIGFNDVKPNISKNIRLYKAYDVLRIRPKMLIVGTSREEIGFSPSNAAITPQPAYNLGISATNIYEIRRYFEHAVIGSGRIDRVLIGVNLYTFNAGREVTAGFNDAILYRPGSDFSIALQRAARTLSSIPLSIDLILQSWNTIEASRNGITREHSAAYTTSDHLPDGQWLYTNESSINKQGQYQILVDYLRSYGNRQDLYGNFSFTYADANRGTTFDDLDAMLRFARKNEIQVDLVFGPSHSLELELIVKKGLIEQFEQLQRHTVQIVDELKSPHWNPRIFDFTTGSAIQTEKPPVKEDHNSAMKGYFDQSHWRPAVGDIVIERIFLNKENAMLPGKLLNKGTLSEVFTSRRTTMALFRKQNPWTETLFDEVALSPPPNH